MSVDQRAFEEVMARAGFDSRDPHAVRARVEALEALLERSIAVALNNRGWLTEVRLCMDLDYNYATCRAPGAADGAAVLIWRGG